MLRGLGKESTRVFAKCERVVPAAVACLRSNSLDPHGRDCVPTLIFSFTAPTLLHTFAHTSCSPKLQRGAPQGEGRRRAICEEEGCRGQRVGGNRQEAQLRSV